MFRLPWGPILSFPLPLPSPWKATGWDATDQLEFELEIGNTSMLQEIGIIYSRWAGFVLRWNRCPTQCKFQRIFPEIALVFFKCCKLVCSLLGTDERNATMIMGSFAATVFASSWQKIVLRSCIHVMNFIRGFFYDPCYRDFSTVWTHRGIKWRNDSTITH
jgi:hypothetical protein